MTKYVPFLPAFLFLIAALAVAGPSIICAAALDRGVFPMDTTPNPYLPDQALPAAASSGSEFLVVWQDARDSSGTGDVYGVLLDTAGTILTPGGFAVVHDTFAQSAPAAVYGDSTYLVVWTDKRADAAGDVYGARVSRSGVMLDPNGIRICAATGAQSEVAVAGGDSCWLVTWTDARQGKDVLGARVSWSGELLDTAGIPVAASYGDQSQPAVASGSDGFYAVWLNAAEGDSSLYGVRVAASGLVPGTPARIAGDLSQDIAPIEPALAFDGSNYLVVWRSRTTQTGVLGRFVSRAGVVGESIVRLTASLYARKPRIVFDGSGYFVCWASNDNVFGVRVNTDGTVGPDLVTITTAARRQGDVAMSVAGTHYCLAWTDERMEYCRFVGGAIVDTAGHVARSDMFVSQLAAIWGYRSSARLCADASGFYVACEAGEPMRWTYSTQNIVGTRLDQSGRQLDERAVGLGVHSYYTDSAPVVAVSDSVYLVLYCWWYHGVMGIRISKAGQVLDPTGFQVFPFSTAQIATCLGGSRFLAVGPSDWRTLSGALVSEEGQVVSPGAFTIQTGSTRLSYPSAAFDGTNFLVVWCDSVINQYVYAKRIDTLGNVIDSVGQYLGVARTNTGGADVAFGDSVYLAVWAYYASYTWYTKGILVGTDGRPRGSIFTISDTSFYDGYATAPRVCFDGRDFVVTWASEDYYHDSTFVAGALVTQGGATTQRFSIVTRSQRPEDIMPDVACGPEGRVLIAYTDIYDRPGPLLGKYRIYGCFLDSLLAVSEGHGAGTTEMSFAASPNPFTRSLRIHVPVSLARGNGTIAFLNAAGRAVRTIPCAAKREVAWDGCDVSGRAVPPGVYFCRYTDARGAISLKLVKVE